MEIKDLTEKDAIHCRTQKEFDRIKDLVNPKFDVKLKSRYFDIEKSETVIYNEDGCYSNIQYAKENGYNIIESSQITR